MGIFNFFIVLPEIIASLFFGWIMEHWLNNDRMLAVEIGGGLMILAGVLCYLLVKDNRSDDLPIPGLAKIEIEEQRSI